MTNYNERLDEVLETIIAEAFIFGNLALGKGVDVNLPDNNHELPPKEKAKQALTSLIKELVAEAKPGPGTNLTSYEAQMFIISTEEYRQNLLKALEEEV